jgi:integrase
MPIQHQVLVWPLRSPKTKHADAAARRIAEADAFFGYVESVCSTRCLIEWQLLTLVRPSEASGARWEEIDLDAKLWTIPAERMKANGAYCSFISSGVNILDVMKAISSSSMFFQVEMIQSKQ